MQLFLGFDLESFHSSCGGAGNFQRWGFRSAESRAGNFSLLRASCPATRPAVLFAPLLRRSARAKKSHQKKARWSAPPRSCIASLIWREAFQSNGATPKVRCHQAMLLLHKIRL